MPSKQDVESSNLSGGTKVIMISNENLIEIIVDACRSQIDHNQVDPKQAMACLVGAAIVIALEYNITDTDGTDIEIDKVLSDLEIKFKDHPNFNLIMGE